MQPISESNYNNVVMLVHPLHDLLYFKMKIHEDLRKNPDITEQELFRIINERLKDPKIKHNYNQTIKEYKEQIQKYKNTPNTLVVLYFSTANFGMHKAAVDYLIKDFLKFSNATLKGRLITSYRKDTEDLLLDLPIKNLSSNIKLFAFGEYKDICVTNWLNKLALRLEETNHRTRSKIISSKTITGRPKKINGLDFKSSFRQARRI